MLHAPFSDESLKSILESCISSRKEGWRALFDAYAPILYKVLRSAGAVHDVAQDMLAELFLRLVENRAKRLRSARFDTEKEFRWWLIAIARNLYVDHLRRHSRIVALDDGRHGILEIAANPGTEHSDAGERLIGEISDSEEVKIALSCLTDRERYYVTLHYLRGLKQREIAELTGATAGGIAAVIWRARDKMRQELKGKAGLERFVEEGEQ